MLKRKCCEKENIEDDICAISLEPFCNLKEIRKLPCGHQFCAVSLKKALLISPICPLCRACSVSGEHQKIKKPRWENFETHDPQQEIPNSLEWITSSYGNWVALDPMTGRTLRAQHILNLETGETEFDIFTDEEDSDSSSIDYEDEDEDEESEND